MDQTLLWFFSVHIHLDRMKLFTEGFFFFENQKVFQMIAIFLLKITRFACPMWYILWKFPKKITGLNAMRFGECRVIYLEWVGGRTLCLHVCIVCRIASPAWAVILEQELFVMFVWTREPPGRPKHSQSCVTLILNWVAKCDFPIQSLNIVSLVRVCSKWLRKNVYIAK